LTEEKELIDRLSRGDMTAFRELVESYKKKMYYFALDLVGDPADAEDVSQEVFLKVFRSFKTFKRDAKLSSWLYRIAYNAAIDHLRRRSLAPQAVEDTVLDASSGGFSDSPSSQNPVQAAENSLLQTRIEKALEKVSSQERAVFLLRHYNELRLNEIAETMQISIGSVKSYLFRCVRKLQKEMGIPPTPSSREAADESL
jgi:RNA polymerase sigma-70 factor (ECF subfamily)